MCKLAACGDGIVGPNEQCDLGVQNSNTGACTLACKNAACGDKFVQEGVEVCDDGNISNTDACVMGCKAASCADGFVQIGVEQCDDGNMNADDGCDDMCKVTGAVVSVMNANKPIVDNGYNGTKASMACVDLIIDQPGTVKDVSVLFGVAHTWVGDTVIKLYGPGDVKVLTLMNRPGAAELDDISGSEGGYGHGGDFVVSAPVMYRQNGARDAELTGMASNQVCAQDFYCDFKPNPGKGPGVNFSDFTGIEAMGTWSFCVGDVAGAFSGTIQNVTLSVQFE